jgi:hypothetical protein
MDHCNGFHFPEADVPPELMFVLHPVKTIFANRKGGGGGGHLSCRGVVSVVEESRQRWRRA